MDKWTIREEVNMAKFKIGDEVKLKKGLEVGKRYDSITLFHTMVRDFEKAGGTLTVRRVVGGFGGCIYALGHDRINYYSEEMLELDEEKEEKVQRD